MTGKCHGHNKSDKPFRPGKKQPFWMPDTEDVIAELGNEPPLIADGRSGPPDRREVSARWLSGTFLTGVTSSVLMGVALFAALDGRQQLATPPEIAELISLAGNGDSGEVAKTTRLVAPRQIAKAKDRRRMEVSMVTKVGDRDVIHTMPFVQIKMALAAGHTTSRAYPPFDPMQVFGDDSDDNAQPATASAASGQIYGAKVESEMSLKTVDFPIETASFDEKSDLSADEVEKVVREAGTDLSDGAVQVASLHYVDPQRFGEAFAESMAGSYDVKIVPENVSVAPRATVDDQAPAFAEEIIPFTKDLDVTEAFANSGYTGEDATGMAEAIAKLLNATALKAGTVLRVGLEVHGDAAKVVRTSVYDRTQHIVTIALNDRGQYVPAQEPDPNPELLTAFDDSSAPVVVRGNLPNVYDGIYRAAYSYGMSKAMTQRLIKLLASDVDFQSRLSPADRIEVLFSQPDGDDQTSDSSELLYVSATFGGQTRNFYRFQMQDGGTDYFDEDGSSAEQFLLRNPLPAGKFRSGFGARRHPILGYVRMHTGVDWSAPIGTPIIAAGNGTVEKVGWAGGYGKQIIIRHANGYETSYNHQSAFAKGIEPGVHVRQGQTIGFLGQTGLATGPHLHYELIVNGTKVDPMRVRLPVGKVLKGDDLVAFKRERERIDELLKQEDSDSLKVASAKIDG
ncbi:MAG: M23 family metallopeptidase [Mesorhizobium sp.]|jgi:murein DD-endopeptidase MepM/ murein hydrolase activator NlpD|nr:M23 family metallopeptidase [Mesorhizobium sp. M7A.F.Ce.TU.012.03.2.1]RUT94484.1 M23 family metallopeptidase [Mesorhizobium sp. M7A.T.Ca.US.000.02.2.1]RUU66714.1 M23 family metallopeptidase [Mesorhizobium sp. M7A.T.Ca.TU.009.01.1.1]RUU80130.1 M23 family metallopeptidase [Mesorhizobium sp. M7A.F.Ca.MR.362.00.0.0]RUU85618.1 M23 family metallopeptidase [Mesorhizobium sp. M7A.F.Ca.MR.176.00.0.0]RUU90544.1 M23 family metallopeptidase [Mesorhizobium sp. M7A.T.Ca.TU.009.01.1.2]RUV16385.1 M23 fami